MTDHEKDAREPDAVEGDVGKLTDLSVSEVPTSDADRVRGGKGAMSDINFTKTTDKSSP
jgi:hypothetical protein